MTNQNLFRTSARSCACLLAVAAFTALLPTAASAASPLVASVLPGGRTVQVGTVATVFATIINAGTTSLSGCQIGLPTSAPASLTMTYQTTDSLNHPIGTVNTPVTIAGNDGLQTFLLAFSSPTAVMAPGLALNFTCTGVDPVTTIVGVNTVDLLFSAGPIPDVIALAATATNNGIVTIPFSTGGAGAFAVASDNVGVDAMITATADTGSATLPLSISICETVPLTGQCMAAPAPSVTFDYMAMATPTFSLFISASAAVPFNAANSRIFMRFLDSSGTSHGATSVAVDTQ